jgi:hypothetical protein
MLANEALHRHCPGGFIVVSVAVARMGRGLFSRGSADGRPVAVARAIMS